MSWRICFYGGLRTFGTRSSRPKARRGRGTLDLDARVRLEVEYIEHYSVWRDLALLARTLPAVASGKGAL